MKNISTNLENPDCIPNKVLISAAATLARREDIQRRMESEPPDGCIVCRETDGSYTVLDATCTVEVKVSFAPWDDAAPYVFYIDKRSGMRADSFAVVRRYISDVVNRKLEKWKRNPNAKPSVNRVIAHYNNGVPMAHITPDPYDRKGQEELKRILDNRVRTWGFGYHQVRGALPNGVVSYILYGKPDKKSEQLLEKLAADLGKRFGQGCIGFSDLKGSICLLHAAKADDPDWDCRVNALPQIGGVSCPEEWRISESYPPIERFMSTSQSLRRKYAFQKYCAQCWDEASQTYCFDQKYHSFF